MTLFNEKVIRFLQMDIDKIWGNRCYDKIGSL